MGCFENYLKLRKQFVEWECTWGNGFIFEGRKRKAALLIIEWENEGENDVIREWGRDGGGKLWI